MKVTKMNMSIPVEYDKWPMKRLWKYTLMILCIVLLFSIVIVTLILNLADTSRRVQDGQADPVLNGTELAFVLMIFRHGDRTPEPIPDLHLFGDKVNAAIQRWGLEQLTDSGLKTAYKTGQFIRRRYKNFFPQRYNHSEVYLRSTDMTRTKMTALAAMAAVFRPSEDGLSKYLNWVPVPYSTESPEIDDLLAYKSCPTWKRLTEPYFQTPMKIPGYEDLISRIAEIQNNTKLSVMQMNIINTFHTYKSLINLSYDVGDEVRGMMADMKAAASKACDIEFSSDDDIVKLTTGVILNEFFIYADKIISGEATPKVRMYSGHDINIASLLKGIQVTENQGVPEYGSLIALELRRVVDERRYIVVPVYMADPHEGKAQLLEVSGCGVLCDYHVLQNLTSKYRLDKRSWIKKCNITEDNDVHVA